MNTDVDVLIIGGGVSGLATAFGLARQSVSVEVLEAGTRPGGVIRTAHRDGMLYELGPNSVLDSTPLVNQMLDALGIRDERIDANAIAATRYIVRDGKLLSLPTTPAALLSSQAFTLGAKWRLWREPFVAASSSAVEESVASFFERRFGVEILDYAVDPFVSGVYAGDPGRISMPAAFPLLHALEQKYGSVIRGKLQESRERRRSGSSDKHRTGSFSFRGGMQTLTDALARDVGRVTTNLRVQRIEPNAGRTWTVTGSRGGESVLFKAKAVVLAVPAYEAARLIAESSPSAANALGLIEYAPIVSAATLYQRADVEHSLDGFGFLVPKRERMRILGTLFSSSMFEGRASPGTVLLTTFVGGVRSPDLVALSDDETVKLVQQDLGTLIGARGEPAAVEITRWTHAIPQYHLGHRERIRAIAEAENALPGLFFCANYRDGVSVADRIKSAAATTEAASRFVRA